MVCCFYKLNFYVCICFNDWLLYKWCSFAPLYVKQYVCMYVNYETSCQCWDMTLTQREDLPHENTKRPNITLSCVDLVKNSLGCHPLEWQSSLYTGIEITHSLLLYLTGVYIKLFNITINYPVTSVKAVWACATFDLAKPNVVSSDDPFILYPKKYTDLNNFCEVW